MAVSHFDVSPISPLIHKPTRSQTVKDRIFTPDVFISLMEFQRVPPHLELLDAFFILQQKIVTSNALDRAFGIVPVDRLETVRKIRRVRKDTAFETTRKVKHAIPTRRRTRGSPSHAHHTHGRNATPTRPGHQLVASWKNTYPEVAAATPPAADHTPWTPSRCSRAVVPQAITRRKGTEVRET